MKEEDTVALECDDKCGGVDVDDSSNSPPNTNDSYFHHHNHPTTSPPSVPTPPGGGREARTPADSIKEEEIEIKDECLEDTEYETSGSTERRHGKRRVSSVQLSQAKKQCSEVDKEWTNSDDSQYQSKRIKRRDLQYLQEMSFTAGPYTQELPSSKVVNWSTESIHRLLECARDFPMLWDPANELFCKTLAKRTTWVNIARQLQAEFPDLGDGNLESSDCQAKFSKLRGSFQREVRKIHKTLSGSATGSVTPKWKFFRSASYMLRLHDGYSSASSSTPPPPPPSQPVKAQEPCMNISEDSTVEDVMAPQENLPLPVDPLASVTTTLCNSPSPSNSPSSSSVTSTSLPCTQSSSHIHKSFSGCKRTMKFEKEEILTKNTSEAAHKTGDPINTPFETPDIAERTLKTLAGFLSLLTEGKKKAVCAELLNVVVNGSKLSADDLH